MKHSIVPGIATKVHKALNSFINIKKKDWKFYTITVREKYLSMPSLSNGMISLHYVLLHYIQILMQMKYMKLTLAEAVIINIFKN